MHFFYTVKKQLLAAGLFFIVVPVLLMGASFAHAAALMPVHKIEAQATPPYTIGQYRSSSWGFFTNSYWLEGPDGVILIDTQFLPSAALDAVKTAEAYTGKKVVLAIVLHANPDKFNGTQALKARGIPVVTSAQVREVIPAVDKLRREWFYDRYQPDYPSTLVLPDAIDEKTETLKAAGLELKLHRYGAAVSRAHLVVEWAHHLFVGDLLANQFHAWLELGLSPEWITLLKSLQALHPNTVHPGRGNATGAYLLQDQIDYLEFVQQTVKQNYNQQPLSDATKENIINTITQRYAGFGMEYFLNLGIPAEYNRLLVHSSSTLNE